MCSLPCRSSFNSPCLHLQSSSRSVLFRSTFNGSYIWIPWPDFLMQTVLVCLVMWFLTGQDYSWLLGSVLWFLLWERFIWRKRSIILQIWYECQIPFHIDPELQSNVNKKFSYGYYQHCLSVIYAVIILNFTFITGRSGVDFPIVSNMVCSPFYTP